MLTFAIGDIHGCFTQLKLLINQCRVYYDNQPRKFVFLGDYIDRGPDSSLVINFLKNFDGNAVFLMGNHEDMMLTTNSGWMYNGGQQTIDSYPDYRVSQDHVDWIAKLPTYHQDNYRIYVHAGLNPARWVDSPGVQNQDKHDLIWIRQPFLNDLTDYGKLVVHGHTPRAEVDIKPNRINIDTACVFGGKLTAAVFKDDQRDPIDFLQI